MVSCLCLQRTTYSRGGNDHSVEKNILTFKKNTYYPLTFLQLLCHFQSWDFFDSGKWRYKRNNDNTWSQETAPSNSSWFVDTDRLGKLPSWIVTLFLFLWSWWTWSFLLQVPLVHRVLRSWSSSRNFIKSQCHIE